MLHRGANFLLRVFKMNNWTIVSPLRQDIPQFVGCLHSGILSLKNDLSKQAIQQYIQNWSIKTLNELVNHEKTHLSCVKNERDKVLGALVGSLSDGGVATIIWLMVEPDHQRSGLGSNLMRSACVHYKQIGCHKLRLFASSSEAKRFYMNFGMEVEGFHPNHWWGDDYYSLGLSL